MASFDTPKVTHRIVDDLNALNELLNSGARLDPSDGNTDIPENSIRLVRKYIEDNTKYDGVVFEEFKEDQWQSLKRFLMDADTLDGFHASKSETAEGIIPVYGADGKIAGGASGESDTAKKLSKSVNIDLSNAVTAEATAFDGSKDITIPIKQLNINNEQDNLVNGILTKLHGGTGRNDGVASDVLVDENAFASSRGQIGEAAKVDSGLDLDALTKSGNYISYDGTTDLHYPFTAKNKVIYIKVEARGSLINQTIIAENGIYIRTSIDTGASWGSWNTVGAGSDSAITIYVSKSGSDDNPGFDNSAPVQTIQKAIEIGVKNAPISKTNAVTLCVGEGDWGDVVFSDLPCLFRIRPYDNADATNYVETLPKFGTIGAWNGVLLVSGVVFSNLEMTRRSLCMCTNYFRFGRVFVTTGSYVKLNSSTAEIINSNKQDNVFFANEHGVLELSACTFKIIENLNLSDSFMRAHHGSRIFYENTPPAFNLDLGISVTGIKYKVHRYSYLNIYTPADSLPGSVAGQCELNSAINNIPYGGGDADTFLAANLSWKKITFSDSVTSDSSTTGASSKAVKTVQDAVNALTTTVSNNNTTLTNLANAKVTKSGDTMTGNLTITNKQVIFNMSSATVTNRINDSRFDLSTAPSSNLTGYIAASYDASGTIMNDLRFAYTTSKIGSFGFYIRSRNSKDSTDTNTSGSFFMLFRRAVGTSYIQTTADTIQLSNGSIWIG